MPNDGYVADLRPAARDALTGADGQRYRDFRRSLKPRWSVVWRDILAGHAVLGACIVALVYAQALGIAGQLVAVVVGALAIGYAIAYLMLFFHEAAHYNIADGRRLNDFLANTLIGSIVGQDIRAYRPIHFDHHRFLGTVEDTERTYFRPLDIAFIVESLTGVAVLRVLAGRQRMMKGRAEGARRSLFNMQLLLGLSLNAGILALAALGGRWVLLAAWVAGVGIVFPFFGALRQSIEHRSFRADPAIDYSKAPHGACTRVFGDGPLASTFGGAGFNRHLLHHWDPQLSYTQLPALERFVLSTSARDVYVEHTSTYAGAFRRLLATSSRRRAQPAE